MVSLPAVRLLTLRRLFSAVWPFLLRFLLFMLAHRLLFVGTVSCGVVCSGRSMRFEGRRRFC